MIRSLKDCANILKMAYEGEDVTIQGFDIDSRRIQPGQCFLALDLARSGCEFVADAVDKGAVAVIASKPLSSHIPHLVVNDVHKAMLILMKEVLNRSQAKRYAMTGSMGKTTTKNTLAHLLSHLGPTHATLGNLNNHFGVPVTLLNIQPQHQYVVIEMGANQPGDIKQLVSYAKPHAVMITGAAACHIEKLKNISGVIQEKGAICRYAPKDAWVYLPQQDQGTSQWVKDAGQRKITYFGTDQTSFTCSLNEGELKTTWQGQCVSIKTNIGVPHLINVMDFCVRVADHESMSLTDLQAVMVQFPENIVRHRVVQCQNAMIIDDTYNASPIAVKAMVDWVKSMQLKSLVVLGQMAELGSQSGQHHLDVAAHIAKQGLDCAFCGDDAAAVTQGHPYAFVAPHHNALKRYLNQRWQDYDVILVKGSRSSRMEDVVTWMEGEIAV
ncbi:MAG: UDP-N-acetylmuramoyl-tripeptide--D-alanyl-D-alanine ligase [Candidatus Comchoanobacterales bacterium]